MSEKEVGIIKTFMDLIPKMSEPEKEKLLSFGEGMAFMKDKQIKEQVKEEQKKEGRK